MTKKDNFFCKNIDFAGRCCLCYLLWDCEEEFWTFF